MQNATVGTDTPINTDAGTVDDGRTIEGEVKVVKEPDNALVVLDPPRFASELFKPFNDDLAAAKRKRTKYDITTKEGMDVAKGVLASLVKIRTGAEKAKTKAKRPIDLAGKEILSQYNALEAACKAEEKKHADAITEENARIARIEEEKRQLERARIEAIEGRIEDLRLIPSTLAKADSATIEGKLNELLAHVLAPADFQEHLEVAIGAQNVAINELRQLLTEVRDRENRDNELARLRAEEEKRKEAAAATQLQQEQMLAIMELQGLANALTAAGQDQDRAAIEAALAKVEAFNPADYGPMAPMATLARDAAKPLLVDLLANLPIEAPATYGTDVVPVEADHTGVIIGAAVVSQGQPGPDAKIVEQSGASAALLRARAMAVGGMDGSGTSGTGSGGGGMSYGRDGGMGYGGGGSGFTSRPEAMAMVKHLALRYGVSPITVLDWIEGMDVAALRAQLAGA